MTEQTVYAVAYARVSTDDHDQNPETQLRKIRQWAAAKGNIEIVREFQDKSTGTNTDRDGLMLMNGFVRANRKISKVIILDADRLSRNMDDAPNIVKDFNEIGVQIVYVANESLDLNTPEGKVMNSLYTYAGEKYAQDLKLKIRAGLDRARAEGKHIGRPSKRGDDSIDVNLLMEFAKRGYSLRRMEKAFKCSRNTLRRRMEDEGRYDEFKAIQESLKNQKAEETTT